MRKKVKTVLCSILLLTLSCLGCLYSCSSINNKMNDDIEEFPEPYSKEDIEKMIRNKYFDKDGNAITEYWEEGMRLNGIMDYEIPEITGFDFHFIKDARTKEKIGF